MGTTAQALRAGVPQLVVPFGFDQPDNAARLERLGVARSVPRAGYQEKSVAAALGALLTDSAYKERARAIAIRVRAEQGVQAACDALEQRWP